MKVHPSTQKAVARKLARPAPNGPAWVNTDPASGRDLKAYRCATCGYYVCPAPSGKLRPHYLHLVGKAKRKQEQYRCQDNNTYSTADTHRTPYDERTATITPAPSYASPEVPPAA